MEVRLVTPDAGAQPGELSPADGSGSGGLLAYGSAQGRWVVAAMIMGSSVAGSDSTGVVGGWDRLYAGRRRAAGDRTEPACRLPGPAMDRHELHPGPGLADPAGRL